MSSNNPQPLEPIRERFIEAAGHFTQTLGVGRVIGQVYAQVYFSPVPLTLDDLTDMLSISKGSASMSVRQLTQWGALQRVWIKGDRKDYYEATDAFGKIIRKALTDMIGQKIEQTDHLLDETENGIEDLEPNGSDEEAQFVLDRIQKLRDFRNKAHGLWESPIVRMLFK